MNPFGAAAPKGMDGSGTGDGLAPMPGPLRNEILFSGSHWNALAIDNQSIAALYDDKVFVLVMHMRSRYRRFTAGPECHLTSIGSVKDVPFYSGSGLTAGGNLVCWMLHEIWKIIHGSSFATPKGLKLSSRRQGHGFCARRRRMRPPIHLTDPEGVEPFGPFRAERVFNAP